jgi:toxin HigB-1
MVDPCAFPFTFFAIDTYKQIVYYQLMIASFASKETEKIFATGKSKKLPTEIITRAIMRLTQLDNAREVSDLSMPPSNALKPFPARGQDSGVSGLMTNGAYALVFPKAKQQMLK